MDKTIMVSYTETAVFAISEHFDTFIEIGQRMRGRPKK